MSILTPLIKMKMLKKCPRVAKKYRVFINIVTFGSQKSTLLIGILACDIHNVQLDKSVL